MIYPQPHAMPTSSPGYTSNREMDAHCGLPVASAICLWMKGDEFSQMEHPLFPLEAEEMRSQRGSPRSAYHSITLTLSITSGEGQTKERGEASETADTAFISVWIMVGEWVTEWLHGLASQSALYKNKILLLEHKMQVPTLLLGLD